MMNHLPAAFEDKMRALLGAEYEEYERCFDEPRHYGLRVNTAKISVEEFLKIAPWPLKPVPWIRNGFYYDGEKYQPAKHPYYFAGLYYLQEPSAMTPADRLPVEPGDRVLDVCAAPGGKATELGAKLNGTGVLAANDLSSSRAKGLLKNLELFGIGNVLILSEEPGRLVPYFKGYFDKILIDAPCSGEGMFRKDRKMIRAWEEHGPDYFSKIQRSIVTQAAEMLREGGMLLYSTCTFSPEENEGTIGDFLRDHPEFHTEPAPEYPGFSKGMYQWTEGKADGDEQGLRNTVRIFPHQARGEGHFIALLKKEGELTEQEAAPAVRSFPAPAEYLTFARENLRAPQALEGEGEYLLFGDQLYRAPACLGNVKGLKVLRPGLHLGKVKKNRFEPAHALAMALRPEETVLSISLDPDGEEIRRYLSGEALPADWKKWPHLEGKKGWVLVCLGHCSAGWAKLSGNALKNHYPKGLRRNAAV